MTSPIPNAANFISQRLLLTGSLQTAYTVTYQNHFFATLLHVCNSSAAPVTVQIFAVPQGQSAGVQNALLYSFQIPSNDFLEASEGLILTSLSSIQALASTPNVVSLTICGYEE